jgi:hypothetical protein
MMFSDPRELPVLDQARAPHNGCHKNMMVLLDMNVSAVNTHRHAIILEGGFDSDDLFFSLPIYDTYKLTYCMKCLPILCETHVTGMVVLVAMVVSEDSVMHGGVLRWAAPKSEYY